jgi:spore coat polysaccharide biosynthesis protein SpsF (cytidylyltransferase family)
MENKIDYLAIIQARTSSTRLPNKVLMKLGEFSVIKNIILRLKRSKFINDIVIATTINKEDKKIVSEIIDMDIRVFCGSENDVLDRFYQVAKLLKPNNIVRITSDCPVIDSEIVDKVIELHKENNSDYTSNTLEETFPDGLDIEVFTYNALENAWKNAKLLSEREHVTPFIRNSNNFKKSNLKNYIDLSKKRWTLDNKEDYEFLKIIFDNLYYKNHNFNMNDILDFINKNPEIENINSHIIRNEGYKKSLLEDKILDYLEE